MKKLTFVIMILGFIFILIGVWFEILKFGRDYICENTTDISWYYKNCVKR